MANTPENREVTVWLIPLFIKGDEVMSSEKDLHLKNTTHSIITLYIRPETSKLKVLDLLRKEEKITDNIKSRATRTGIQDALQRVITFVELMPPSENGYVICAAPDQLVYSTDTPITVDQYYCGGEFFSQPLDEMLMTKLNPVGILCIDSRDATLAYVKDSVEIVDEITSGIAGKHNKGGQSQRRFEREREQELEFFFQRAGKRLNIFLDTKPITALIVSGPGMTKEQFLKTKYVDYRLRKKLLETLDTQYTGESGARETLHKALPLLEKNAYAAEIKLVEEVFEILGNNPDRIVYGKDEIASKIHLIKKIVKTEEIAETYPVETVTLHFHGEHYDQIKALGGVVGIRQ
jgi:peptide chain release factor subunit 1